MERGKQRRDDAGVEEDGPEAAAVGGGLGDGKDAVREDLLSGHGRRQELAKTAGKKMGDEDKGEENENGSGNGSGSGIGIDIGGETKETSSLGQERRDCRIGAAGKATANLANLGAERAMENANAHVQMVETNNNVDTDKSAQGDKEMQDNPSGDAKHGRVEPNGGGEIMDETDGKDDNNVEYSEENADGEEDEENAVEDENAEAGDIDDEDDDDDEEEEEEEEEEDDEEDEAKEDSNDEDRSSKNKTAWNPKRLGISGDIMRGKPTVLMRREASEMSMVPDDNFSVAGVGSEGTPTSSNDIGPEYTQDSPQPNIFDEFAMGVDISQRGSMVSGQHLEPRHNHPLVAALCLAQIDVETFEKIDAELGVLRDCPEDLYREEVFTPAASLVRGSIEALLMRRKGVDATVLKHASVLFGSCIDMYAEGHTLPPNDLHAAINFFFSSGPQAYIFKGESSTASIDSLQLRKFLSRSKFCVQDEASLFRLAREYSPANDYSCTTVPLEFMRCIEMFCNQGCLKTIVDHVEGTLQKPRPSPHHVLHYVQLTTHIVEFLRVDVVKPIVENLATALSSYLESLSNADLRHLDHNVLCEIFAKVDCVLRKTNAFPVQEMRRCGESLRLAVALKQLRSPFMQQRLAGLRQIRTIVEEAEQRAATKALLRRSPSDSRGGVVRKRSIDEIDHASEGLRKRQNFGQLQLRTSEGGRGDFNDSNDTPLRVHTVGQIGGQGNAPNTNFDEKLYQSTLKTLLNSHSHDFHGKDDNPNQLERAAELLGLASFVKLHYADVLAKATSAENDSTLGEIKGPQTDTVDNNSKEVPEKSGRGDSALVDDEEESDELDRRQSKLPRRASDTVAAKADADVSKARDQLDKDNEAMEVESGDRSGVLGDQQDSEHNADNAVADKTPDALLSANGADDGKMEEAEGHSQDSPVLPSEVLSFLKLSEPLSRKAASSVLELIKSRDKSLLSENTSQQTSTDDSNKDSDVKNRDRNNGIPSTVKNDASMVAKFAEYMLQEHRNHQRSSDSPYFNDGSVVDEEVLQAPSESSESKCVDLKNTLGSDENKVVQRKASVFSHESARSVLAMIFGEEMDQVAGDGEGGLGVQGEEEHEEQEEKDDTKDIATEALTQWFKENHVVEVIFGPDFIHTEVLKRCSEICRFLAGHNLFSEEDLDLVWDTAFGTNAHESIRETLCSIISDLARYLPLNKLNYLWTKIKNIDLASHDIKSLSFVRNFTVNAVLSLRWQEDSADLAKDAPQQHWYGLGLFWDLVQDSTIISSACHKAALQHLTHLCAWQPCFVARGDFLRVCIKNLELAQSVPQSLKLMRAIITSFPLDGTPTPGVTENVPLSATPMSRQDIVCWQPWLVKICLENLKQYKLNCTKVLETRPELYSALLTKSLVQNLTSPVTSPTIVDSTTSAATSSSCSSIIGDSGHGPVSKAIPGQTQDSVEFHDEDMHEDKYECDLYDEEAEDLGQLENAGVDLSPSDDGSLQGTTVKDPKVAGNPLDSYKLIGKYSHLRGLRIQLNFLRFLVISCGKETEDFQLTADQADIILENLACKALTHNERSLALSWVMQMHFVANAFGPDTARTALPFTFRKLSLSSLQSRDFSFFEYFFRVVNVDLGRLTYTHGGKPRPFNFTQATPRAFTGEKNWLHNKSAKELRRCLSGPESTHEAANCFQVVNAHLVGLGMLWCMALRANCSAVAKRAAKMLCTLFSSVSPSTNAEFQLDQLTNVDERELIAQGWEMETSNVPLRQQAFEGSTGMLVGGFLREAVAQLKQALADQNPTGSRTRVRCLMLLKDLQASCASSSLMSKSHGARVDRVNRAQGILSGETVELRIKEVNKSNMELPLQIAKVVSVAELRSSIATLLQKDAKMLRFISSGKEIKAQDTAELRPITLEAGQVIHVVVRQATRATGGAGRGAASPMSTLSSFPHSNNEWRFKQLDGFHFSDDMNNNELEELETGTAETHFKKNEISSNKSDTSNTSAVDQYHDADSVDESADAKARNISPASDNSSSRDDMEVSGSNRNRRTSDDKMDVDHAQNIISTNNNALSQKSTPIEVGGKSIDHGGHSDQLKRIDAKSVQNSKLVRPDAILQQPEHVKLLTDLLFDQKPTEVVAAQTWDLIQDLPTREDLFKSIQDNSASWDSLLDLKPIHKTLYSLQIMDFMLCCEDNNFIAAPHDHITPGMSRSWARKAISLGAVQMLIKVLCTVDDNDSPLHTHTLGMHCVLELICVLQKLLQHCSHDELIETLEIQGPKLNEALLEAVRGIATNAPSSAITSTSANSSSGKGKTAIPKSTIYSSNKEVSESSISHDVVLRALGLRLWICEAAKAPYFGCPATQVQHGHGEDAFSKEWLTTCLFNCSNENVKDDVTKSLLKYPRDGQGLLKSLSEILSEVENPENHHRTTEYFTLLADLARSALVADSDAGESRLSDNMDTQTIPEWAEALFAKLFAILRQHKSTEKRSRPRDAPDQTLCGLLFTLEALLSNSSICDTFEQQQEFVRTVFDECLFDIEMGDADLKPKCKNRTSRSYAFQVLLAAAKSSRACLKDLLLLIEAQHKQTDLCALTTQNSIDHCGFPSSARWAITDEGDDRTIRDREHQWQYDPASQRKADVGYVGLRNLGCICYMNSLLQQLYMIPELRLEIFRSSETKKRTRAARDTESAQMKANLSALNSEGRSLESDEDEVKLRQHKALLHQTRRMFTWLQESEKRAYDMTCFCNKSISLNHGNPIDIFEQQDVDEFFNVLMDQLEHALKDSKRPDILRDLFGGVLCNQILCKEGCSHRSEREEKFMVCQLEVKGKQSIKESLDLYVEGEMLEGDNKYLCGECNEKRDAQKRAFFVSLPNVLMIHLKRFDFDLELLRKIKVNDHCEFPSELNMKQYTREALEEREENMKPDAYYEYELVGILVHTGTADSGHYYSYIKERFPKCGRKSCEWFHFNDEQVSQFDPATIPEATFGGMPTGSRWDSQQRNGSQSWSAKPYSAYMLIYERKERPCLPGLPRGLAKAEDVLPVLHNAVPKLLQQTCWQQNVEFMRDEMVLDAAYGDFVLSASKIVTEGSPPSVANNLSSSWFEALQACSAFAINTLVHARNKEHLDSIMTQIKTLIRIGGPPARRSMLENLEANGATAVRQLLLRCPIPQVRDTFLNLLNDLLRIDIKGDRILYNSVATNLIEFWNVPFKPYAERQIYDKRKTDVENYGRAWLGTLDQVQTPIVEELGEILWEDCLSVPCVPPLETPSLRLIGWMIAHTTDAHQSWRNVDSLFAVMSSFADLGRPERVEMVRMGAIPRILDFLLDQDSPSLRVLHMDKSRELECRRGMGEKYEPPTLLHAVRTLASLVRTCDIPLGARNKNIAIYYGASVFDSVDDESSNSAGDDEEDNGDSMDVAKKISLMAKSPVQLTWLDVALMIQTPLLPRLLENHNSFWISDLQDLLLHLGTGSSSLSWFIANVIRSQLFTAPVIAVSTLFRTSETLLSAPYNKRLVKKYVATMIDTILAASEVESDGVAAALAHLCRLLNGESGFSVAQILYELISEWLIALLVDHDSEIVRRQAAVLVISMVSAFEAKNFQAVSDKQKSTDSEDGQAHTVESINEDRVMADNMEGDTGAEAVTARSTDDDAGKDPVIEEGHEMLGTVQLLLSILTLSFMDKICSSNSYEMIVMKCRSLPSIPQKPAIRRWEGPRTQPVNFNDIEGEGIAVLPGESRADALTRYALKLKDAPQEPSPFTLVSALRTLLILLKLCTKETYESLLGISEMEVIVTSILKVDAYKLECDWNKGELISFLYEMTRDNEERMVSCTSNPDVLKRLLNISMAVRPSEGHYIFNETYAPVYYRFFCAWVKCSYTKAPFDALDNLHHLKWAIKYYLLDINEYICTVAPLRLLMRITVPALQKNSLALIDDLQSSLLVCQQDAIHKVGLDNLLLSIRCLSGVKDLYAPGESGQSIVLGAYLSSDLSPVDTEKNSTLIAEKLIVKGSLVSALLTNVLGYLRKVPESQYEDKEDRYSHLEYGLKVLGAMWGRLGRTRDLVIMQASAKEAPNVDDSTTDQASNLNLSRLTLSAIAKSLNENPDSVIKSSPAGEAAHAFASIAAGVTGVTAAGKAADPHSDVDKDDVAELADDEKEAELLQGCQELQRAAAAAWIQYVLMCNEYQAPGQVRVLDAISSCISITVRIGWEYVREASCMSDLGRAVGSLITRLMARFRQDSANDQPLTKPYLDAITFSCMALLQVHFTTGSKHKLSPFSVSVISVLLLVALEHRHNPKQHAEIASFLNQIREHTKDTAWIRLNEQAELYINILSSEPAAMQLLEEHDEASKSIITHIRALLTDNSGEM